MITIVLAAMSVGSSLGLSHEYWDGKIQAWCAPLDQERVSELRAFIERAAGGETTKVQLLKAARSWCDERGIRSEYDRCAVALVNRAIWQPPTIPNLVKVDALNADEQRYATAAATIADKFVERRSARVHDLKRQLREAAVSDRAGLRKNLREAEEALEQESGTFRSPPVRLESESVARLGGVIIEQILHEQSMLVQGCTAAAGPRPVPSSGRRARAASPGELLSGASGHLSPPKINLAGPSGGPFFVDGIGTHGLVDGQKAKFDQVVKIVGTRSYATPLGTTQTVYVAEPAEVDDQRVRSWFEAR